MPNVSTYIRTQDLSKYLAIAKDKGAWTEFVHSALNQDGAIIYNGDGNWQPISDEKVEELLVKPIKTPKDVPMTALLPKQAKLCKHGFSPEFCKFSKPGKPCR